MGSRGEDAKAAAPPVQELDGLGAADVPARYVTRGNDRPAFAAEATAPVPVIDLARLCRTDGGADDEAARLRQAMESWGLFLVNDIATYVCS